MAQQNLVNLNLMYKVGKLSAGPKPIDWAKAFDPVLQELKTKWQDRKKRTEDFINKMPTYNISKLPEELRPMVTKYLAENKDAYANAAKATQFHDATSKEYIAAVEQMNTIRGGFETLSSDLELLAQHRKQATDKLGTISPYASDSELADHSLFSSEDIYKKISLRNGRIYYTSDEGFERTMNDFTIASQSSTDLAKNVNTLHEQYRKRAEQGNGWDETGALRAIDLILKDAGSKGVGDLMYTYYIDDYIKENYGVDLVSGDVTAGGSGLTKDLDPEAYQAVYDQLKSEDLTEEFRDHFVGMLGETHNKMYKPKVTTPKGGDPNAKLQYGSRYLTNSQVRNEVNAIINAPDDNFQIVRNDNLGKYYKTGGQWYYFDGETTKPVTVNDVIRGQQYYGYEVEEERDPNLNPLSDETSETSEIKNEVETITDFQQGSTGGKFTPEDIRRLLGDD